MFGASVRRAPTKQRLRVEELESRAMPSGFPGPGDSGEGQFDVTIDAAGVVTAVGGDANHLALVIYTRDRLFINQFSFPMPIVTRVRIDLGRGNNLLWVLAEPGRGEAVGDEIWLVSGNNSGAVIVQGYVPIINFTSVQNLFGGNGGDLFYFDNGASITGILNGGPGDDVIVYTPWTTPVTVSLILGTATGTGGIFSIKDVVAGQGDDVVVGDAGNNLIAGGPGRDLLIGGLGGDLLLGEGDDDILIAGRTDYDANPTALAAIQAIWVAVGPTYATRVASLGSGSYPLTTSTVYDDGIADFLLGGSALDWFFANPIDFTDQELAAGEQLVSV